MELTVDPGERGHGHGSRLVQAAVETMAADGFTRAVLWAVATDEALREFLTGAGWAPDTAHRELDLDGDGTTLVKQVRLHTDSRRALDFAALRGTMESSLRAAPSGVVRQARMGSSPCSVLCHGCTGSS